MNTVPQHFEGGFSQYAEEGVDPAPQEIFDLLGGGDFVVTTGAKEITGEGRSLRMRVPSRISKRNVSHVEIRKNDSGTYDARTFKKGDGGEFFVVETSSGVPADNLRIQFAYLTGLSLSL